MMNNTERKLSLDEQIRIAEESRSPKGSSGATEDEEITLGEPDRSSQRIEKKDGPER